MTGLNLGTAMVFDFWIKFHESNLTSS